MTVLSRSRISNTRRFISNGNATAHVHMRMLPRATLEKQHGFGSVYVLRHTAMPTSLSFTVQDQRQSLPSLLRRIHGFLVDLQLVEDDLMAMLQCHGGCCSLRRLKDYGPALKCRKKKPIAFGVELGYDISN